MGLAGRFDQDLALTTRSFLVFDTQPRHMDLVPDCHPTAHARDHIPSAAMLYFVVKNAIGQPEMH